MFSLVESEKALKKETNRTLWNLIINAGENRRDRKKQDAERARYTSRCRLLTELLENDGD